MKKIKIVADSSSDVLEKAEIDFAGAALKIITAEKEFVDNASLDVAEMVSFLSQYKGRSRTSCPNAEDWLSAFGDADEVICVTITSGLSGSYNTARAAKQIYEETEGKRPLNKRGPGNHRSGQDQEYRQSSHDLPDDLHTMV